MQTHLLQGTTTGLGRTPRRFRHPGRESSPLARAQCPTSGTGRRGRSPRRRVGVPGGRVRAQGRDVGGRRRRSARRRRRGRRRGRGRHRRRGRRRRRHLSRARLDRHARRRRPRRDVRTRRRARRRRRALLCKCCRESRPHRSRRRQVVQQSVLSFRGAALSQDDQRTRRSTPLSAITPLRHHPPPPNLPLLQPPPPPTSPTPTRSAFTDPSSSAA